MKRLVFLVATVAAAKVEFNRDVRPILSDKCFACHGPDAKTKNIALRLDVEADAKARAIVPGKPEESELIKRVTAERPARRMPPAFTGHKLSEKEIETLKQWIREGAPWQAHWAFLPPQRAANGSIDSFIRARLDQEGLKPSPRASKETLLRRLSFDLTGLPPSVAEIDAFLADSSTNAYEKAVDRLLASPRYGERMAARWLDAARYADTNGYQFDGERVMWRWRDWVIDAFNRNQPFDQFTIEQLAGDLLPNATLAQRVATGFNRNHRGNTEDGIVPEEYAVEYVVDRVETTSATFLGLTLGCARCHNHKYDPLSQRDFYRMYAFFNNVPESGRAMKYGNSPPYVMAPTREQQAALQELDHQLAKVEANLAHTAAAGTSSRPWIPQAGLDFSHAGGDTTHADYQVGYYDIRDHFSISARVAMNDGALLTKKGKGETAKGYGVLVREGKLFVHFTSTWESDAIKLESERKFAPGEAHHLLITYDGTVSAAGFTIYLDGRREPMKVLQDNLYRPLVNAGATFRQPFATSAAVRDVKLYGRVLEANEIAALAGVRAFPREAFLEHEATGEMSAAWKERNRLRVERDRLLRSFPTVMVMAEQHGPRRQAYILERGAYDKPGAPVEPGLPEILSKADVRDRLSLARWMVSQENPLTARVVVNRVWAMYFGTGLVKTTEDFGQQGEWPSHPELLDWLAVEFRDSGWDLKRLHKLIVMSDTYQQSSKATPALLERDPENRLLARGPRFRLAPEMIRDNALAVSGLLKEKLGGPSVKPYQPAGLWKELVMQDMDYVTSKGDDLYRRGLYTFWKRTVAPPMMANFDAANHEACVVREARTNTPLQALNLMNDVTFLEAARFLAERMILEGGSDTDARLTLGFRAATGRRPRANELEILRGSLRYHLDYFASSAARAEGLLQQGDKPSNPAIPARDLAAYASVASLILNLDETVTKE
ncbi:MAG: DUF1553 domain-containing protein [Bryobacteraceae bacterium]|nr:DUF1553 domain-containing protein [Bryobacteraceae bacterium]